MKNNAPRATKREKERIDMILALTCVFCTLSGDFRKRKLENHHIVRGNKRLGHWYTLQVCVGHHRGEWTDQPIRVGISSGRHALKEAYGYDELELWQRQQVALRLDDTLPPSKLVPRRVQTVTRLSLAEPVLADGAEGDLGLGGSRS
jgi:Recombination enhancement, RecA-dependent nuclease